MRGIEVPERTEDFTADPVELFFDLSYVLAFSQLVGHLIHHPDWSGVGEAALLFLLMWLPWSQFTWSANAVSGNGRTVRIFFLVATAISVPMAAAVSTAFGAGGTVFAVSLGLIYVIAAATMGLGVDEDSSVRQSITEFASTSLLAIAVLIAGSFLDRGPRTVLWVSAALITLGGMLLAGRREWIVRSGHFAERHGLIIIIALGEVIVAIGLPVVSSLEEGQGLPATTLVALVAAGVFAGLMWWGYFDRPGPSMELRSSQVEASQARGGVEPGRFARDVYTMGHAPIVAGIILSAAAIEEIALHPDESLPLPFRVMLAGGLGLTALGITAGVWRSFHVLARERLGAAAAIALLLLVAADAAGLVLLAVVDLVILAMLVVEHLRVEHPYRHT